MKRWLVTAAALAALTLGLACKTSTGTAPSSPGDDAGGGDATACPCRIEVDGGPTYTVACGAIACAGTSEYLCENGVPALQGPCLPPTSDVCAPLCPANLCNVGDGCGGQCRCPANESCVFGQCSTNGCLQGPGEYCGLNPEAGAGDCCASGYKCPAASAEGGVPTCCALTNEGDCGADADCCDAPSVKCTPILSDGGVTVGHRCL